MSHAIKINESRARSAEAARSLESCSDVDLLEAWRRDAHAPALASLVERYSVMVLSVCRRRCRSEADAEDAYQTTFLYLARNSHKIRRPECLAGWLQRVAQRAATATLHVRKRETETMVEPPVDPDDPFDRLTQRHEAIVLDEELADLPEHYRAALVMHCYEDRSIASLAEHFGTSIGSIRGRLQRGKQLLAQRLRRRGVVPIVAFTAAQAWTVSATQAASAAEQLIDQTAGDLPDPPIDTPLLESLLSQGVRLMPSLYTAIGLLGGSALIASMMAGDGHAVHDAGGQNVVSIPSEISVGDQALGQFGTDVAISASDPAGQAGMASGAGMPASAAAPAPAGGGMGGDLGSMNPFGPWTYKPVPPKPDSAVAKIVEFKLDSEVSLNLSTTLDELPNQLESTLSIPVLLDDRGLAFAKQNGTTTVNFTGQQPLRTALRRLLRPMGLKAAVEAEGLVITADPAALVHRGIGVNRWINIDQDAEQAIADKLDQMTNLELIDVPLEDMAQALRDQHQLPIVLDQRALEDIGLSPDQPVTCGFENVSLRSALNLVLQEHDLTYTVQGESLVITTDEEAESKMISRIYWLEGTGYADTEFDSVMKTIQTSISPQIWEQMGGSSTIVPLGATRPALVVSTTYTVHEAIERFFDALREVHFGEEPVLERIPAPAAQPMGGMGGMGGGMGGMGGGGMF